MPPIFQWLIEKFSPSNNNNNNNSSNTTRNGSYTSTADNSAELATSTYYVYKSINVNAYRASSSANDGTGGGNYYIAGVLFMVSVIGLLLYVNLYYEYCFRDTCFRLSKYRMFFFLRQFFVTTTSRASSSSLSTRSNGAVRVVNVKKQQPAKTTVGNASSEKTPVLKHENVNHNNNIDDSKDDFVYKVYI